MNSPVVSMVSSALATETRDVSAELIIEGIRTGGNQRLQVERIRREFSRVLRATGDRAAAKKAVDLQKKQLQGVLWSGRFSSREKPASDKLQEHSGLLCADLDELGDRLPDVRAELVTSEHLWALFLSPSGDGLKAIFRVPADEKMHAASFRAVEQHVRELSGVTIDGKCKEAARLCFVSFDPDAYHNASPVELLPTVEAETSRVARFRIGSTPELETRRRIAGNLLGEITWTDETHGYCACPGRQLHMTSDGERDCELHIDGAPTLYCFHNSCTSIVDASNHELRRQVGEAQRTSHCQSAQIQTVERAAELRRLTEKYCPPPLTLLPSALRDYVRAAAETLNVDTSYILLPLLSALGSAIGDSRSIMLKPGFIQPPIIWTGIIGRSGSRKSPALDAGCVAVTEYERELTRQNKAVSAEYDEDLAAWEGKQKKDRGAKPEPPLSLTCLMDDMTLAALADAIEANPRGVLVKKDELSNWFAAMDQFHDAKGADVSRWLSLHTGAFFGLDRKTDRRRSRLWNPRICITGGIQPAVLSRVLTQDFFERGLPARFLFAAPPSRADRWSERSIDARLRAAVIELFTKLYQLVAEHENEEAHPKLMQLEPGAKAVFVTYYNECGAAAVSADERGEAAWSKLSGYAARLALVGQCASRPDAETVTAEVMAGACELAQWFGAEAVRIYATMSETAEQSEARRLAEFIQRRGGAVTVRELVTNYRPLKNKTEKAEAALSALIEAGYGTCATVPTTAKGGKPTREFRLSGHAAQPSASAIPTSVPRQDGGYADADTEDGDENAALPELEEALF